MEIQSAHGRLSQSAVGPFAQDRITSGRKRNLGLSHSIYLRGTAFLVFLCSSFVSFGEDRILQFGNSSKFILSAPHGKFDMQTGLIAKAVHEGLPKWTCVVVEGFRRHMTPINVNRPTEGIGLAPEEEIHTEAAKKAYEQYMHTIEAICPIPQWYVELHGNKRRASSLFVEVATHGLSVEQAKEIKRDWGYLLCIHGLEEFSIQIEPIDHIYYSATGNKCMGAMSQIAPSLHIELPESLRFEKKAKVIFFLQQALLKLK